MFLNVWIMENWQTLYFHTMLKNGKGLPGMLLNCISYWLYKHIHVSGKELPAAFVYQIYNSFGVYNKLRYCN